MMMMMMTMMMMMMMMMTMMMMTMMMMMMMMMMTLMTVMWAVFHLKVSWWENSLPVQMCQHSLFLVKYPLAHAVHCHHGTRNLS